jgi:hypothetical protein
MLGSLRILNVKSFQRKIYTPLHGDDKIDFWVYNEIETLFHNFPKLGLFY